MNRIPALRIAAGLALCLAAVPPGFTQGKTGGGSSSPDGGSVLRVYRVDHIDIMDAALRAQQICLEQPGERDCEYQFKGKNWISFLTDEATQARVEAELQRLDVPQPSLNFRITLLLAGSEPGDPELSNGERRALEGLRQFLPYRGYRLVDTGWIRSQRRASLRMGSDPPFQVSIVLSRGLTGPATGIGVERFELHKLIRTAALDGGPVVDSEQELIGSSFTMDVGETVVVGTSKLDGGDEALVVLLTATE